MDRGFPRVITLLALTLALVAATGVLDVHVALYLFWVMYAAWALMGVMFFFDRRTMADADVVSQRRRDGEPDCEQEHGHDDQGGKP